MMKNHPYLRPPPIGGGGAPFRGASVAPSGRQSRRSLPLSDALRPMGRDKEEICWQKYPLLRPTIGTI